MVRSVTIGRFRNVARASATANRLRQSQFQESVQVAIGKRERCQEPLLQDCNDCETLQISTLPCLGQCSVKVSHPIRQRLDDTV
jgi:hypothetical protein